MFSFNNFHQIGQSPLFYACGKGFIDAVKMLLEEGSDVNAKSFVSFNYVISFPN